MPYPYPPSDNLLEFGQLLNDSYFFIDGRLMGGESSPDIDIECFCEVGYNEHLQVTIACYPKKMPTEEVDNFIKNLHNTSSRIVGVDLKSNQTVILIGLTAVKYVHHMTRSGSPPVFAFDATDCIIQAEQCQVISSYETEEPFTVEYVYVHVVGLEYNDLLNPDNHFFQKEYQDGMPFNILERPDDSIKLTLLSNKSKNAHPLEPTWLLRIPPSGIPPQWTPEFTASFWCALVSLATGRDVQWITISAPFPFPSPYPDFYKQRFWNSRNVIFNKSTSRFVAPIAMDVSILAVADYEPLSQVPNWQRFVEGVLVASIVNKIPVTQLAYYTSVIQNYMSYRLTRDSVGLGELRLVTTLTEELLFLWQKFSQQEAMPLLSKAERKKLERVVKTTLDDIAGTPDDYLNENQDNRQQITEKVLNLIREEIRQVTFAEGLSQFFKYYGVQDELNQRRIKAFVDTRNSIAHRGVLSWQDSALDKTLVDFGEPHIEKEYANAMMMIPRMICCVLGYRGLHYDLLFPDEGRSLTAQDNSSLGADYNSTQDD